MTTLKVEIVDGPTGRILSQLTDPPQNVDGAIGAAQQYLFRWKEPTDRWWVQTPKHEDDVFVRVGIRTEYGDLCDTIAVVRRA